MTLVPQTVLFDGFREDNSIIISLIFMSADYTSASKVSGFIFSTKPLRLLRGVKDAKFCAAEFLSQV